MDTHDIDTVIAALRQRHPQLRVERVRVKHPGVDDDGVWDCRHPSSTVTVSLESSTGTLPFRVESTGHLRRRHVATAAEAVSLVQAWLGIPEAG